MSDDPIDSFAALFAQSEVRSQRLPRIGQRVEGKVVHVGKDAVFIELDGKRQAFIEAVELRAPDGSLNIKEGDLLAAQVVEVDEAAGQVRLGRSMTGGGNVAGLEQAKAAGIAVDGKVTGVNKGGIEVEVAGQRAFCPNSQIDRKGGGTDPKELVGRTLPFLVMEVRDGGKSIVVSRRALLEREAGEVAKKAFEDLAPGSIVRGTVTAVRDFGAFVDLGGIEGMIPASQVTHDRSRKIEDALKPGDAVEVMVRELKPSEKGGSPKITLSLKALAADPWDALALKEGEVVTGSISRVTDFGAFVRLAASGVEGLLHVSEIGGKKEEGLRALKPGEAIAVVVRGIDKAARRISLVPAPHGTVAGAIVRDAALAIGAVVKCKVDHIETYGIFVQIDGTSGRAGRGLIPSAELGVPRGTDLRKTFPEGSAVTAKILETGDRKLRLSIKAAKDAEERADFEDARGRMNVPATLGTFGDLLKKSQKSSR